VSPGDRIYFNVTNSNTSFENMTEIDVITNISIIQGEDFLEIEEVIPYTIPVGESASLIYRVIENAEAGSKVEISFRIEGISGSSWFPSEWEETVMLNYNNSTSIPTLSEWKRIFLVLFIMSSSIAFIRHRKYVSVATESTNNSINKFQWGKAVFENNNYQMVFKWNGAAIILGTLLIGMSLIGMSYQKITFLDIIGLLICSPLLAYIINAIYFEFKDLISK
jgi:hypothetical protein